MRFSSAAICQPLSHRGEQNTGFADNSGGHSFCGLKIIDHRINDRVDRKYGHSKANIPISCIENFQIMKSTYDDERNPA